MTSRREEIDLLPSYEGDPADAAALSEYLESALLTANQSSAVITDDKWEEAFEQLAISLRELMDYPMVAEDPVVLELISSLLATPDFEEFVLQYDCVVNRCLELLQQQKQPREKQVDAQSLQVSASDRTRLVL
ncbi:hypothetical protein [Polycladidibacter hongkongensis]|uniref:hypothetical protein n=1 Tax=Polycladidibacter hongkongensis TaxID=1647556 RepID=UPI0008298A17|nr:hypothetical protein [Pseudovibrio hongkongensis]